MNRLRALRERRNWSQSRMAEFLGCDQSVVSRIERGQPEPGPIAKLLDLMEAGLIAPIKQSEKADDPEFPAASGLPESPPSLGVSSLTGPGANAGPAFPEAAE